MAYITSLGHKRPRRPSHALPGEVRVQKKTLNPELSTVLRHSVLLSLAQFSLGQLEIFFSSCLFGLSSSSVSQLLQMPYCLSIFRCLHFTFHALVALSACLIFFFPIYLSLFPIFPSPASISFYYLLNHSSYPSLLFYIVVVCVVTQAWNHSALALK